MQTTREETFGLVFILNPVDRAKHGIPIANHNVSQLKMVALASDEDPGAIRAGAAHIYFRHKCCRTNRVVGNRTKLHFVLVNRLVS